MTHQVLKGWWGNVAKIAPRFQVGGGPYGVVKISGKLENSWEEEPEKKHMNGAISRSILKKKLLQVCDFFNSQKRPCPTSLEVTS